MKQIAVIYKSKYGSTKKYAEWLAEELGADLIERRKADAATLKNYDVVVYGGGLYVGSIAGVDLVAKNPCKNLVVFTVGFENPETKDFSEVLSKDFSPDALKSIKTFHLRGSIDYESMSLLHKGMMAGLRKLILGKKGREELAGDDQMVLDTYGGSFDLTDRAAINPIVEYVRSL